MPFLVWIHPGLLIDLLLNIRGHLDCFHLLAVVTKGTINICVQVFGWMEVFSSFG